MMQLRQSRAFLLAIVSIAMAAWLVASNHCAFAALASQVRKAPEHACCHSEKGKSSERSQPCCDSLAAPALIPATAPIVHLTELMPAWNPSLLYALAPSDILLVNDHLPGAGPPGSSSFAVLVLNRSLLAHAPPFFTV